MYKIYSVLEKNGQMDEKEATFVGRKAWIRLGYAKIFSESLYAKNKNKILENGWKLDDVIIKNEDGEIVVSEKEYDQRLGKAFISYR